MLVGGWDAPITYNKPELAFRLSTADPEHEERDPFQTARDLSVRGVLDCYACCLHGLSPFDIIAQAIEGQTIPHTTSKPRIVSNHLQ